jgi:DNA polymerase-3 subunit delta
MKLEAARVGAFLHNTGSCRVVLLHGEDGGLVRERADALVRSVAGSLNDPFRVADIDSSKRIADELAEQSLTGGRRVVRLREATDAATASVQAALAGPGDGLLVLEAAILPARSKLRVLVEQSGAGVAIGCARETGRALEQTIRAVLAEAQVSVDEEALQFLADQLGADRASTRAELEKLALLVGSGGTVGLAEAATSVGDMAGLQLDDALFAATSGNVAGADRALEVAMAEGLTSVGVLRMALGHMQRLQRVRAAIDMGADASAAVSGLRPPLFGRRLAAFQASLLLWSGGALAAVCQALWEAELACKRTGAPAEVLCRNAVIGIARRAARVRYA